MTPRFRVPILLLAAVLVSGCAGARPRWTTEIPPGYRNDYLVGTGTASSQADARRRAVTDALTQRAEQGDLRLRSLRSDSCTTRERVTAGRAAAASAERDCLVVEQLITLGEASEVRGLAVAEWYDERDYSAWQSWALVRIPKTTGSRSPPWRLGIVARSALVPGWGQRVLGEPERGRFFAIGTVLLGAGGTVAMVWREQLLQQAASAEVQSERDRLISEANQMRQVQWGGWSGAAGLYGINVLDAMTSRGRLYLMASPLPGAWTYGVHINLR